MRITSNAIMAIVVFVVCGSANTAFGQSNVSDVHQTTTTPSNARFEIVQSQLAARWTFRLDRYTGRVHQLVSTEDEGSAWQRMLVAGIADIAEPNRPRSIFTSGLAVRHTFLMDTDTGQTWVLGTVGEITGWWPFEQ